MYSAFQLFGSEVPFFRYLPPTAAVPEKKRGFFGDTPNPGKGLPPFAILPDRVFRLPVPCPGKGCCPWPFGLTDQPGFPASLFWAGVAILLYSCTPKVGERTFCSSFPSPRYICTPQGRQGSKLRTARIISMPLKLSGPFSSKMGVCCTASS